MRKMFLQAGLVWLVSMAFGSCVLGQTGDSSMHQQMLNSLRYSLRIENDKIVELSVDGRRIPPDSFSVYEPVIRKLRDQAAKDREQSVKNRERARLDREQAMLDKEQIEKDKLAAERDKLSAERDMLAAEQEKLSAEREKLSADRDKELAELDAMQAMRDREQASRDRKLAEEDREILEKVIGQIVKDGLARDENSIESITLNHEEFMINGKRQPEAIHKKYVTTFLVKPGYKVLYHHDR